MWQTCENGTKLQERSKNDKLPSPRKSRLSRDLSRKNAKSAVKFMASRLRGLHAMDYCVASSGMVV